MSELKETVLRGLRVRYRDEGTGPPLLLVHGFVVSHLEWEPVWPELATSFRCIAPDLPGFGESDKPAPRSFPYTREAFAELLVDLLHALAIDRAHVCGHSLGGAIALTLAADYPAAVNRMSLVDPACYSAPAGIKARIPLVPFLGPLVFRRLYGRRLFRDYFRSDVFNRGSAYDEARVDRYYDAFDPPEARAAAYATLRASIETLDRLTPKIGRVHAPTLLIWGEQDALFPLACAYRLAHELRGSRLEVISGVGHAPNEERPGEVAAHLRAHFASR